MKYHLWTIGCQMNEADSRHLSSQLEALGYHPAANAEEADLVVLNTCVVRQQAEDKARGRLLALKAVKERRPGLLIGLMGCLVGLKEAPRLREQYPFVDVFMPPSNTEPLLDLLETTGRYDHAGLIETREKALRDALQDEEFNLPSHQRGRSVTAHVPVVLGCSHSCTFCIIPYRRGAERSRPPAEIFREVRRLAGQGVREVMLLGQIVDRYGVDFPAPYDLADLLHDLSEIPDLRRIRFLTSHPNWMTDKLIDTVRNNPRLCPQFEVPAQAGNDEVLGRMRRGYTVSEYRRVVDRIRDRIPEAGVHTDIIAGFPGETEDQFMDTVRLIDALEFDKVHIAKYSPRPKTIATRQMTDDVAPEEKERRRVLLENRQREIQERKNRALRGQAVEVLAEERDGPRWRGRTPQGRLVFFDDAEDRRGQLVTVQIDWTGPFSLIGRPAEAAVPVAASM